MPRTTLVCFVLFFHGVLLHSRLAGACPVTTDLTMRVNVRTYQQQQKSNPFLSFTSPCVPYHTRYTTVLALAVQLVALQSSSSRRVYIYFEVPCWQCRRVLLITNPCYISCTIYYSVLASCSTTASCITVACTSASTLSPLAQIVLQPR